MTREAVNPSTMYESVGFGFSHAVTCTGGKAIHCAGQTAWDKDGNIIGGGDLGAQTDQVLKNLKEVLSAAGATPADVVRMRTYVVNHSPDKLETICSRIGAFYGDVPPAPNTLIGVQALALPDFLIEIEVTAVID